jgi:hypothetical protein
MTANQPLWAALGVAGAQNHAGRLVDDARGIIDEGLTNGRDQRVVGKVFADFLFGDEHRR